MCSCWFCLFMLSFLQLWHASIICVVCTIKKHWYWLKLKKKKLNRIGVKIHFSTKYTKWLAVVLDIRKTFTSSEWENCMKFYRIIKLECIRKYFLSKLSSIGWKKEMMKVKFVSWKVWSWLHKLWRFCNLALFTHSKWAYLHITSSALPVLYVYQFLYTKVKLNALSFCFFEHSAFLISRCVTYDPEHV